MIRDAETGVLIKDFGNESEGRFVFLTGGNGGWGNVHFKSSTNQAPRTALPGQPSESRKIRVELNIIADIGFVGFPNAGKSSLLNYFTNARPKIAPYPFTTKIPNLGVLRVDEEQDIILADIPGIIEGASEGHGLGIRFLKHISRSAGLAFIIDLSDDDFLNSYDKLQAELADFSAVLAKKDRIVIANKLDLPGTPERLEQLREKYPDVPILGISVQNRWGLDAVRDAFIKVVADIEPRDASSAVTEAAPQQMNEGQPKKDATGFMSAQLDELAYPVSDTEDFGATISLSRKRKGRKK